jgi:hypothetical protein
MFVANGIAIGLSVAGVLLGLLDGFPLLAMASLLCLVFAAFTTVRGLRRTHVEVR